MEGLQRRCRASALRGSGTEHSRSGQVSEWTKPHVLQRPLAKWPQVLAHTCESRASGTLAKLAIGGEQLCRAMHMQLPQFDCIQFGRDRLSWQNEPISACSLTN